MSQPFIIKFFKKLTSSRSDLDEVRRWFKKVLRIKKKKKKKFKLILKKPILVGFVLFLIIAGVFYFLFSPSQAIAEWWNTNWHYRQAITVTNSGSAQTDFQVKILENYDMSVEVSAGKVQADFDDLRFTNANGQSVDYWIEDDTATSLDVWARIPSISTGDSVVYMYYGNPSAGSGKVKIGTSSFPGFSCKAILDAGDSDGDGVYWIDPSNGDFSDKFQAYCDMTTDGGGWTLITIRRQGHNNTESFGSNVGDFFRTPSTVGNVNGLSDYDSYMLALSSRLSLATEEYLFRQRQGEGSWDTGNAFVIWSEDDLWPDGDYNEPLNLAVNKICDYNNSNCDTTDVYWKYVAWGHYNSSQCTGAQGGSYYGNYGYCHNGADNLRGAGISTYNSNSLFGNRSGYSETKLWNHSNEAANWAEYIYIRGSNYDMGGNSVVSFSSEERGPGPVAYWSFDEGYGTTALDKTSNANHGTLYSQTASWQDESMCISGKCVYFNGESSTWNTVRVDNDPSLDGMDSLTVSVWVKLVEAKSHQIIYKRQDGGSPAWYAYYIGVNSSNRIEFRVSNASGPVTAYTSNNVISLNKWHHIIAVYNGSNLQVYVDGVAAVGSPPPLSGKVLSSTGTLQIGGLDGSSITHGFIDEPKIYPYARTEAQILADYNARGGATSKGTAVSMGSRTSQGDSLSDGLVGYWKMDETSGNVIDASGNGNTGTPTGTTVTAGKYGNARSFNGTSDYVSLGGLGLSSSENEFALSAWVRKDGVSQSYGGIVGCSMGSWRVALRSPENNNSHMVYVRVDDDFGTLGTTLIEQGDWHYLTLVFKDGVFELFLDGVAQGYLDKSGTSTTFDFTGLNMKMGTMYGSDFFNGLIDEVRIYNRALSAREVKQLYEHAPGPVGHWKMDKKTGTNIYDSSGLNNTGVLGSDGTGNDVPSWAQGKYGSGLEFYDDHIKFNDSDNLDTGDLFTFEGWYNFSDLNFRSDIYFYNRKNQSGTAGFHIIYFGSNQIRYQYANGTSVVTKNSNTLSWNTDQWYHIAVSHDNVNKEIKFYRDGILVGTSTYTDNALNVVSGNAYLGGYQGDSRFRGKIDDIRIYNYARTQKQILEDMNAGRPAQKSPIAHWKFDEGYSTTAYDSGLSGNDGTITGASWTNEGKLGKALDFNGTSDYVSCGSVGQSESFSLGTWLFPTSIPSYDSDGYFYAKSGDSYLRFSLSQNNLSSNVRWRLPGGSYTSYYLSENNSINEWVYINVVYDGLNNVLKGYKNGELQNIYNDVDIYGDFGQNLEIGRNPVNSAYYTGLIDDVKIYNYALTEDEIRQEYNQGKTGVMGAPSSDATGGGYSSALEYCVPGDDSYCAPPVGEWKFDEKTGDTIYDTSDNNNTGTINGMLLGEETWTIGKIGSALEFDGSNDYVKPTSDSFYPTCYTGCENPITVSAWIKTDNFTQESAIAGRFDSVGSSHWYNYGSGLKYINGSIAVMGRNNGDNDLLTYDISDPEWHYVVGITNTSNGKLYVDGVLVDSGVLNSGYSYNFCIGAQCNDGNSYNFDGIIDNVRVYDYARTPAQIAWDYNKGKPIAHWRFDEGQGATLYDSSGNENHGTLNLGSLDQTEPGSVKTSANTPWYNGRQGKLNYSLNFDGNDDYVRILDNPIDENIWSISMWFNIKESDQYDMLYSGNIDNTDIQLFFHATSKYLTTSVENVEKTTTFKINDHYNEWHHVIWTHSNSNETNVYIDGKNVLNTTDTTYIKSSEIVDIGSLNGNNYFIDGQIDEVKIYNYALTEDQIKTEYNMGAARFGTGN